MRNLGVVEYLDQGLAAEPGDIVYCSEDNQIYEYFDEELGKPFGWRPKEIDKKQLINSGLTEYEVNKMIIQKLPSLINEKQLAPAKDLLRDYMRDGGYFMLLCNDIHYYTVLEKVSFVKENYDKAEDVVIELLTEKGVIQSINYNSDESAVECWIKNQDGCFMFLLFNYDWGVVTCQ